MKKNVNICVCLKFYPPPYMHASVYACVFMYAYMRACMCAYIHAEITPHTKKVHGCVQNETNRIGQAP